MESLDGKATRFAPTNLVRITRNEEIAPAVFAISFPRTFDFVAGQVVALTVDPGLPERYYSIASGESEENVTLLYDLVVSGVQTPRLASARSGDAIMVSEPFGSFIDRYDDTWWIATGTGIAPFLSMARSGRSNGKTLIHGGRTLERFYFHDSLTGLLGPRYVCCCSSERADWAYSGRLTRWLSEQESLPRETRYMLCGSAGMVVEVRDILIDKGVPFENVSAEIYF